LNARLLDLDAVARAVRAETFAVYGSRQGGLTAMAYAARHPERVTCLIAVNSFSSGEQRYRENPVARMRDTVSVLATEQWHTVTDMMGASTLPGDAGAGQTVGALLREAWDPDAFMAYRQATREIDLSADLATIDVPTLIVATDAAEARFEHSRELAAAIPNARFVSFTSAPAVVFTERDYATLGAFLREHTPSVDPAAPPTLDAAPPRGRKASASRTIIYTDIVGNTDILQRLGDDAWRAVLRDHERITRELLRAHDGAEVKTMGDGFMASFDSATSAIECAIDLQRSFAARNHTAAEPMLVRVGLNAGEPIEEDDDLFGTAVTMAARIMGQGAGGEILVSEVVRALVAGKSFVFADRGEFAMKGFDDTVRLYEVRWRA